jgi:hypothetical protein
MNISAVSRNATTGVALIAVLAATRVGHLGGIATPPDASLAVFFLLGQWLESPRWLVISLLTAAAADAVAIAQGASSYCITPAYPFLIPTYSALWGAGRVARAYAGQRSAWRRGLTLSAALLTGVTVAFVLANASFYTLSGYFQAMPAAEYVRGVTQYFRPFLIATAVYVVIAIVCRRMLLSLAARRPGPAAENPQLSDPGA